MPFDNRGRYRREACPSSTASGTHTYGRPFRGKACSITWCVNCRRMIRWHAYNKQEPDMDGIRADIAEFDESMPELLEGLEE